MKKLAALLVILLILSSPGLSKDKKIAFDENACWSYIKDMAADSMQGRRSGQPGGKLGAEYIASKFKEWGLEPAGDNNTFFQTFTIEHRNIGEGLLFEVITKRQTRRLYYRDDFRVQNYSGSGHFFAEIVFVGFGIHAPDSDYDDYSGVDVQGKIVLMAGSPSSRIERKAGDAAKMEARIQAARNHGAKGIIFFKSPSNQSQYFYVSMDKKLYDPNFVMLTIEDRVVNFIFKDLPTDLRYVFQQINGKGKPFSLETNVKVHVAVNSIFDEKRVTRNVLAKITGSDKRLKDECVIIGGHMDHLGVDPSGDVYNGANDNASGTAVVMEIARIMKLNKTKPARTVIFAGWAGEEQGLLGSEYYADNPVIPMDKTIVYINMDMVGHGSGNVPFRGEYYGPKVWNVLKEKLPKEILEYVKPGRGGPGGSDHSPFLAKGVAAYAVMTQGHHFKYHRIGDDIELIKPEILKRVGDFVHAAVNILSFEPGDFLSPLQQENYQLKYQKVINFKLNNLDKMLEHRKNVKNHYLDLQLSMIPITEGLTKEASRVDFIDKLLKLSDNVRKAGLVVYTSSSSLNGTIGGGRTTVLPGIRGLDIFQDNPKWVKVAAQQGLFFAYLEKTDFLFNEDGENLSDEGKDLFKTANRGGLLLMIDNDNPVRIKALLKSAWKPFILLSEDVPDKEILDLIEKKECALGLTWDLDTDPEVYIEKINAFKESLGTKYLTIFNKPCLWKDEGKDLFLKIISQMIKAEYDRSDLSNIFSSTFIRVLDKVRGVISTGSSR